MRGIALIAALVFACTAASAAAPCKDPKTGKFIRCPAPAAAPAAHVAAAPHCTTGKLCGKSCIPATAVCHQPPH